MSWEKYTYACGHLGREQMLGPHEERRNRVARKALEDCPECSAVKAQAQAIKEGLPLLVGTDKQVTWAAQIRSNVLPLLKDKAEKAFSAITKTEEDYEEVLPTMMERLNYTEERIRQQLEKEYAILRKRIAAYNTALLETNAHWWIENYKNGV